MTFIGRAMLRHASGSYEAIWFGEEVSPDLDIITAIAAVLASVTATTAAVANLVVFVLLVP